MHGGSSWINVPQDDVEDIELRFSHVHCNFDFVLQKAKSTCGTSHGRAGSEPVALSAFLSASASLVPSPLSLLLLLLEVKCLRKRKTYYMGGQIFFGGVGEGNAALQTSKGQLAHRSMLVGGLVQK